MARTTKNAIHKRIAEPLSIQAKIVVGSSGTILPKPVPKNAAPRIVNMKLNTNAIIPKYITFPLKLFLSTINNRVGTSCSQALS